MSKDNDTNDDEQKNLRDLSDAELKDIYRKATGEELPDISQLSDEELAEAIADPKASLERAFAVRELRPQTLIDSSHVIVQYLANAFKSDPGGVRAMDINANRLKATIFELAEREKINNGEIGLGCLLVLVDLADDLSRSKEHDNRA